MVLGKCFERRKKEKVLGAVIRYGGENFLGEGHAKAWDAVKMRYPEASVENEDARGWLTTKGRIVDEREAYKVKLQSGQIKPDEEPPALNE